jgi:hypothetical protein
MSGPSQRAGTAALAAAAQHQRAAAVRVTQQQLTAAQAPEGHLQSATASSAGQVQPHGGTHLSTLCLLSTRDK